MLLNHNGMETNTNMYTHHPTIRCKTVQNGYVCG